MIYLLLFAPSISPFDPSTNALRLALRLAQEGPQEEPQEVQAQGGPQDRLRPAILGRFGGGRLEAMTRFLIGLAIVLTSCSSQPFDGAQDVLSQSLGDANQEQSLLILINSKRLDLELPALITSTVLMDVAEAHSQDMATNNYLAHANLAGLHGGGRLTEAGYEFSYWGEAIAGGSTTPAVALDGWLNSPPHKAVLLDEKFQEVGLGFAFDSETKYGYYWVVVVARPADE